MNKYNIRANYDDTSIRVYQAYCPEIALPALEAQRFVPPFKMSRMTWIKPSFNWMMYRCGYASKPGQEIVLGIDITREGFEWALQNAALSTFKQDIHGTHEAWKRELETKPVRIQWDPERDWKLNPMEGIRSIQIGLSGEAVDHYVNEWTLHISGVTPMAKAIAEAVSEGRPEPPEGHPSLSEKLYPLPPGTPVPV